MTAFVRCYLVRRKGKKKKKNNQTEPEEGHGWIWSVVLLLCSGGRGRELHHRPAVRPQPQPRLAGDPGLREQPRGEDGGDVLPQSQLLVTQRPGPISHAPLSTDTPSRTSWCLRSWKRNTQHGWDVSAAFKLWIQAKFFMQKSVIKMLTANVSIS